MEVVQSQSMGGWSDPCYNSNSSSNSTTIAVQIVIFVLFFFMKFN